MDTMGARIEEAQAPGRLRLTPNEFRIGFDELRRNRNCSAFRVSYAATGRAPLDGFSKGDKGRGYFREDRTHVRQGCQRCALDHVDDGEAEKIWKGGVCETRDGEMDSEMREGVRSL